MNIQLTHLLYVMESKIFFKTLIMHIHLTKIKILRVFSQTLSKYTMLIRYFYIYINVSDLMILQIDYNKLTFTSLFEVEQKQIK